MFPKVAANVNRALIYSDAFKNSPKSRHTVG